MVCGQAPRRGRGESGRNSGRRPLANLKEALNLYSDGEVMPETLEPPIIASVLISVRVPLSFPVVSGAEVVAALGKIGFRQVGQRGGHVNLRDRGGRTVIVSLHRELARGALSAILRQAGVTLVDLSYGEPVNCADGRSVVPEGKSVDWV